MKKRRTSAKLIVACLITGLTVFAFASCQAMFTYSPVAFLQRDTASLSTEQKVERAKDVLVSGSAEEVTEAYEAVAAIVAAGDDSAETNLLAADLAFASSGISDFVSEVLEDPEAIFSSSTEDLTEIFESLDTDLISAGASYVQTASADEDADISDTQYVIAGAALVASAAEEAGGFDIFEDPPDEGEAGYEAYSDATEFFSEAGIEDIQDLFTFSF